MSRRPSGELVLVAECDAVVRSGMESLMPSGPTRRDPAPEAVNNAVAYVRCSSDRQARQESSIPAQRADIERRAQQDGATVVRWFEDDGISGKNVEDRPGLNALLDYIAGPGKGTIARMYVYDSKRMARNKADAFAIRKELHGAKVQLVALAQPRVEDEAANAILESVWDGIAKPRGSTW